MTKTSILPLVIGPAAVAVLGGVGEWAFAPALRVNAPGALSTALALTASAFSVMWAERQRSGRWLSAYNIVILVFAVTYPCSAVAHLLGGPWEARGFYDFAHRDPDFQGIAVYQALLLVLLAWCGLLFGMGRPLRSRGIPALRVNSNLLRGYGSLFIGLGLIGTYMLFREAPSLFTALSSVTQSRVPERGLARFDIISKWLSWGVLFWTVPLLHRFRSSGFACSVITSCGVALVLSNTYWGGGRTSGLLAAMPLMLVHSKASRTQFKWPAVIGAGVIGSVLIIQTIERTGTEGFGTVTALLDWQGGRFSMIGAGLELSQRDGFALGSTMFADLIRAINGPAKFIDVSSVPYAITNIIAGFLIGDSNVNGIVPGTICELYYNFGFPGVAAGYGIIGFAARKAIHAIRESTTVGRMCCSAFFLTLICTSVIPGTAMVWLYVFATHGLPAWLLYVGERLYRPHVCRDTYGRRQLIMERPSTGA